MVETPPSLISERRERSTARRPVVYNPIVNHFAYKLNDKLYDITGCCDKTYEGEWVDWNYYQLSEPQHSKRIKNYCMYKIWE